MAIDLVPGTTNLWADPGHPEWGTYAARQGQTKAEVAADWAQLRDPAFNPVTDLDAVDTVTLNSILLQPGSVDRAELKTLFNHENRLRALEGKAAITQAQFVTAVKAVIR